MITGMTRFEIYRLNFVDFEKGQLKLNFNSREKDIFSFERLLREVATCKFDRTLEPNKTTYCWSLRSLLKNDEENAFSIILSRAIPKQKGPIITDNSIELSGTAEVEHPIAILVVLIFFMDRHLVAVEHNSVLMSSQRWLKVFHEICDKAAKVLEYDKSIRLESIPKDAEIIKEFNSFSKITRLRVHLMIPNPELTRYTEKLFTEMRNSGIKEYFQDMKNINGINLSKDNLPFASVAMAQDGYKKEDVRIEGIKEGKRTESKTGRHAAIVSIPVDRETMRESFITKWDSGLAGNINKAITLEMDRIKSQLEVEKL